MTEHELTQYRALLYEIRLLEDEIARLRAQATDASARLDGQPRGSIASDRMARLVADIVDLTTLLDEQRRSAVAQRQAIETWIAGLDDAEARTLLRLRYIDGKSWREIGAMTHRDWSWARRKVGAFWGKTWKMS